MKKLIFTLLLLPLLSLAQDKVKFIAGGVTCSMCSSAIHKSLSTDKSIIKIDPNLQTQEWNLEFKTGEFKIENLKKKVEEAGFSIVKVWLNNELILNKSVKKNSKEHKH